MRRWRTILTGFLVVLLLTSLSAPIAVAEGYAQMGSESNAQMGSASGQSYQIVQGTQVIPVEPISGNTTVE